ncbi:MAG: 16S rRNA (cytosine(967)-C(5))-methyltransferase RsmB [Vicinamibacterales bacterium]
MIGPARTAALTALRAVEDGRIDLPTALVQSRERLQDDRDRALAADIIVGTLRWRAALDHVIVHIAGRSLDRLDPEVVTILRLSLYQILHLTRVPASAVVDDAVDLVRGVRKPSATGFVNAVLRGALRQKNRLPLPARPDDQADRAGAVAYLSVSHSHPAWLIERWLDRYGFAATERWVEFNNVAPALSLRANRLRISRDDLARQLAEVEVETRPADWSEDGLIVTAGNPLRLPRQGLFVVQDEASQLVPLTVDVRPGARVLDLCASPGGKATAMAGLMADRGLLVACDVRPRRTRLLRDAVHDSGALSIRIVQVPRSGGLPFGEVFERVLVDAPCSGLGTLRRDPDIKWRRLPDDLPAFAEAQRDLLDRAAAAVAPGGRLVYATCSSEPEENDEVVRAFLAHHDEFTLVPAIEHAPSLTPLIDADGFLRTLPFEHGLEAFFAAAMVRRDRVSLTIS